MTKRKYEIMFVLQAADYPTVKEEVKSLLENNKCEIEKEEDLGIKHLGYPIKKQEKGFYYLLYVMANPASLKELNDDVRLNERILKHMALVYDPKKIKSRQYRRPARVTPPYQANRIEQDRKVQTTSTTPEKKNENETVNNEN